jgi:hypothetical protein
MQLVLARAALFVFFVRLRPLRAVTTQTPTSYQIEQVICTQSNREKTRYLKLGISN